MKIFTNNIFYNLKKKKKKKRKEKLGGENRWRYVPKI